MKKITILFIVLSTLISCLFRDNPIVKIKNSSNKTIDSIEIFAYTSHKTVFKNVKPNERVKGIIELNNLSNNDGNYNIKVYSNNLMKQQSFGYFTNGASLDYQFNIAIEKDTILIKN